MFNIWGKGLLTDFFCETGLDLGYLRLALAMTVDLWNLGMLLAISQQKHIGYDRMG
jgi:hypothetical protein